MDDCLIGAAVALALLFDGSPSASLLATSTGACMPKINSDTAS